VVTQNLITRLSKLDTPDREPSTMDEILEQQARVNVLRPGRIALLRAKEASNA